MTRIPVTTIDGEPVDQPPSEAERVEAWRLHVLLKAGYPLGLAERLAAADDVALHQAVELVQRGCGHELAARILL